MTINISTLKVFLLWYYIPLDFLTSHWFLHVVKPQAVFSSVQSLSHVLTLQPQGLQHARPPCPSPTPRAYSNSCPLSWSCHPTISSSVVAGSELCPWQRSWGRRLGIRKGGIEPQESPWKILEHLPPKPESAYFLLCAFTYTSDFTGGCPPLPLSEKRVSLQLQLIIPGCDSVSTYKLLWKSSSLPE